MADMSGGDDPLRGYEEKLEEIERTIAEAERKEEERAKQLEQEMQKQMNDRVQTLSDHFTRAFEDRMSNVEGRYKDHIQENVNTKQTDVLRVNKMIRDVSRMLPSGEWKMLFEMLMASFPKDVVDAEMHKIEQQRPFMQAYKAITTWKDMKGEDFKPYQLAEGLRECGNYDLAGQVLDILDTEGDALMSLNNFGKAGRAIGACTSGGAAEGLNGFSEVSTETASPVKRMNSTTEEVEGPLGDSKLLQLSRKVGAKWHDLGVALGVPQDELAEIRASEDGYQAAFKMLWGWRDSARESGSDGIDSLISALESAGLSDLVSLVQSGIPASNA